MVKALRKRKKVNFICEHFIGEFVTIHLRQFTTAQTEEESITMPMAIEGFLVAEDTVNFYIASNSNDINIALLKEEVLYMIKSPQRGQFDSMLESLPDNPNKDTIN